MFIIGTGVGAALMPFSSMYAHQRAFVRNAMLLLRLFKSIQEAVRSHRNRLSFSNRPDAIESGQPA